MNKNKQAACMLILNDDGQVLLVTRRDSTEVGLPGGKVDAGETFLEAAIRETFEETGILIDESTVEEVFSDVCLGEVNYETKCFETKYNGKAPLQLESGIIPKWGSISELIENSPFKEYNKKLLEAVN